MSVPQKYRDSHYHRSLSLDALRLCIRAADQRIVVLAAPSGFGKSELARAYCECHPEAEYLCATEPGILRCCSEKRVLFVDEAERLNGIYQRSLRSWQLWFLNRHPNAVLVLIAQDVCELLSRGLLRKPVCLEIPSWVDERAGVLPRIRPRDAFSSSDVTQSGTLRLAANEQPLTEWVVSLCHSLRRKLSGLVKRARSRRPQPSNGSALR